MDQVQLYTRYSLRHNYLRASRVPEEKYVQYLVFLGLYEWMDFCLPGEYSVSSLREDE